MTNKIENKNEIVEILEDGDIVYVITSVKANRSINSKADRKVDEVLIFGFNKKMHFDLYQKYVGILHD